MENARIRKAFLKEMGSGEEFLRLFELIPGLSFFMKDRDCRFIALNQRGCEYCGVEREEDAIGLTDHSFFPSQRADAYRDDDLAVMNLDQPILNRIESAPEYEGSARLVMTSKLPIHDSAAQVIGIFGVSRQVDGLSSGVESSAQFSGLVQWMYQNFGEAMTTVEMASMVHLSVSQFERLFRNAFGTSPRQFLLRIRTEQASRRLAETGHSISQIALECGFYDHAHFSRYFKRQVGLSPSAYRLRYQG